VGLHSQGKADRLGADAVGGLNGEAEGDALTPGWRYAFLVYVTLDHHDALNQLFGAWGAAGDVDIYRDELVTALDDGVGVEDAAGAGAGTHGDDPLGFAHLFVGALEDGEHLDADSTCDDEEVGLARAEAHDFSAEAGEVKAAAGGGHEFDAAAGGGEGHGPETAATSPVDDVAELGGEESVNRECCFKTHK